MPTRSSSHFLYREDTAASPKVKAACGHNSQRRPLYPQAALLSRAPWQDMGQGRHKVSSLGTEETRTIGPTPPGRGLLTPGSGGRCAGRAA